MKTYATPSTMYCQGYGIHRWWPFEPYGYDLHGAYFLVCDNIELYQLQNNLKPHVACIVDDFGNLVRKP